MFSICRFALEMASLRTWLHFDWTDFKHLQALKKTFKVRHWPLSNEPAWAGSRLLKSPKAWGAKRPARSGKKAARPTVITPESFVPDNTPVITIWDSDEDGLAGASQPSSPPAQKKTKRKRKDRTLPPPKKTRHTESGKGDDHDGDEDEGTAEAGAEENEGKEEEDDDQEEEDGEQEDEESSWSADEESFHSEEDLL